MKKIFNLVLAVAIMLSTTVCAMAGSEPADLGSFVSSPSGIQAPILIDYFNTDADCEAELKVSSYADRNTLSADDKARLEAAYGEIFSAEDLGDISEELDEYAKDRLIASDKLSVSELFDISHAEGAVHDEHGEFVIELMINTEDNFFAILHYTDEGWELIEGEEVDGQVTFRTDSLSPFAVVVHDGSAPNMTVVTTSVITVMIVAGSILIFALIDNYRKRSV